MIVHHPLVISLGTLSLSGYGVALALALMLALLVIRREYVRTGTDPDALEDVIIVALVGLVGAKGYDVLTGGASWLARGGFSMVGGVVLVPPTAWWLARRRGMRFAQLADPLALGIAAAIPVARTGCWAIGDDYGRPLEAPWAVAFPHGAPPSTARHMAHDFGESVRTIAPDQVLTVHPTQLYEVVVGLLLFVALWRWRRRARPLMVSVVGVAAVATSRLLLEFVRAKGDRLPSGLTVTQFVCAGIVVVAALAAQRTRV